MSGDDWEIPAMDDVKDDSPAANVTPPEISSNPASIIPLQPLRDPAQAIFIGPHGLRAGWRVLLYLGMWRVCLILLRTLVPLVQPHGVHGIWLDLIGELEFLAAAFLPAFVMAAIENCSIGDYGLPRRPAFGKLFWVGMLWGIVAITALMLAIGGFGDFSLGGLALHGARILKFAAFWGGYFVCVGVSEEFLTRGYAQFTLTEGIGFWSAALLLSTFFLALHLGNPGETFVGLLAVAAIGLFFCLTLRRTGNLWFAVGFHAAWDWGESYLYSVPDSGGVFTGHLMRSSLHGSRWITGGSDGPEGSLLVFLVLALTWLAFDRVYPEVKYRGDPVMAKPA
jgi:membrane protease YdiL (CAAX protease family)